MGCKHGNEACRLCTLEEGHAEAARLRNQVARLEKELEAARRQHGSAAQAVGYVSEGVIKHALSQGHGASAYIQPVRTDEFPVAIYTAAPPVADTEGVRALISAAQFVVREAIEDKRDHVHVCDRKYDDIVVKQCSSQIQDLRAALSRLNGEKK